MANKIARLVNSHWNQVAVVVVPAQRGDWPHTIVWGRRVFAKATTGYEQEKYRERTAYFPAPTHVKKRFLKHG